MHMKYFIIDEEAQVVKGMLLPRINVSTPFPKIVKTDEEALLGRKIKTPILMASSEGQEEGKSLYLFIWIYSIFERWKMEEG